MRAVLRSILFVTVLLAAGVATSHAQPAPTPSPPSADARQQELRAAMEAAVKVGTHGPANIKLLDQAVLRLPKDMLFVPPAEATRLLRAWGNRVTADPTGLVIGMREVDDWFVVIRYANDGYVKDDDAKDWNADELLSSLREGTEESNKDRVARGFPELEIIGWIAPPHYDSTTHRLVWSMAQKRKGEPTPKVQGVNYNTNALGREGHFSLNLVTDTDDFPTTRPLADALLAGLVYNDGKRYQDFNPSTDHVAEYGLAALIGVVAAKKLGLLALVGAFVLKFAKVGVLLVVGAGAAIMRFLRGGRGRA